MASPPPYPPVGKCIYCGAERYASDSKRELAEEHIIPFGLNGELTLPQTSCRRCERITGRNDGLLLKGALLGCRTHLGLRTRSPKERPKALPLFDATTTPNRKVMVPMEDFPVTLLLLSLDAPRALVPDFGPGGMRSGPWLHRFTWDLDVLRWRYGLTDFGFPSLDTNALCRVLAKTAHSYAVAELGLGGFSPLLLPLILGDGADPGRYRYVGGQLHTSPPGTSLHEIGFEDGDAGYLVVKIRLFASLGAPVYRVVVGTPISLEARPRQAPTDAGGASRTIGRTTADGQ